MKKLLTALLFLALCPALLCAAVDFGALVSFDRTVYDWGDVSISDGPLSCSFDITNISRENVEILSVVSSCGCTNVDWTRGPIAPGKHGSVSAVYANEDGAQPFDKTLSVYVSGMEKPIILHLRGIVHKDAVTLENSYPLRMSSLGFRETCIKAGNMSQGEVKSTWVAVANFSDKPCSVQLRSRSPFLTFGEQSVTLEPRSFRQLSCTVSSDRSLWGRNSYFADVLLDGATVGELEVWAVTKENFSSWTREQKKAGPKIDLEDNTFTFKPQGAGKPVEAVFKYSSKGDLIIYKVDSDSPAAQVRSCSDGELRVSVDTRGMEKGEQTILLTLFTNSPLRPMVNLFITGFIR